LNQTILPASAITMVVGEADNSILNEVQAGLNDMTRTRTPL